jgi:hypothetical protein
MQTTSEQLQRHEQVPTDFLSLDQRTHLAGLDTNRFAGDDRLHVRFFTKPVQDSLRSELENRPIYRDAEIIEIWIPGDKSNINVREVQLDDKMRFRKRYEDWKANVVTQVGTPLKLMPFLTESEVEELAFFRITTVEQLAGVNDSSAQGFNGLQGYKEKAKAYLASQTDSGALLARIKELEALVGGKKGAAAPAPAMTDTLK